MAATPPARDVVLFGASGDLASRKGAPRGGRCRATGGDQAAGRWSGSQRALAAAIPRARRRYDRDLRARVVRLNYGDAGTYGGLRETLRSDAAVYYLAAPPST